MTATPLTMADTAMANADQQQLALELGSELDFVALDQNTTFYEDTSSSLSIADARALHAEHAFLPIDGAAINFGYTGFTYWLHVPLVQTGPLLQSWILEVGHVRMADFAVYLDRDGTLETLTAVTGADPVNKRSPIHRLLLADITLAPDEPADLYIKYRSYGSSHVNPSLSTPKSFFAADASNTMFHSFIFGAITLLAIYNLVMSIMLRSIAHLWYVLFVVSGLAQVVHQTGFAFTILWSNSPGWNSVAADYLGLSAVIAGLVFGRSFLQLKQFDKKLDLVARTVIALTVLTMLWCFIDRPFFIGQIGFSLAAITAIVNFIGSLRAYQRGHRAARFAILGWASMAIALSYTMLSVLGFLPVPGDTSLASELGMIAEGILFSASLADQVTELRLSRDKVQQDLILSLESETKASNKAAAAAEEKAAALAEAAAKGQVLSTVSHDVRQPIHALRLYVRGIRNKADRAHTLQGLEHMEQTITSLEQLLSSVMDSAAPESSGDIIVEERFSAERVLSSLQLIFGPLAADKGLQFRIVSSSLIIYSDRAVIMRIMNNLVSNAVKYTQAGRILVGCRRRGDKVVFQVMDTGQGIPPLLIDSVFGAYNRLDPASSDTDSFGLGLSIVRQLADRIGAEISVRSVPGKGTLFEMLVPSAAALPLADQNSTGAQALAGQRALIIDDNVMTLGELEDYLISFGMEVVAGATLEACLEQLPDTRWKADVILSDLHLAGGRSGSDEIRKALQRFGKDTPAFIVTFDRLAATRTEVAEFSAASLLYKPIDKYVLHAQLLQHLQPLRT